MSVPAAIQLIGSQAHSHVQGILVHHLFGDHPSAPFKTSLCEPLLQSFADSEDADLARYSGALLLGSWPWFTKSSWRPSQSANRSVALLVKGLGLRKRAPRRRGILNTYFQNQYRIGMPINWRKALGKDFRAIEERCLRLQKWMVEDPSARVMSLDTFNESLIQAFSTRHPALKAEYRACTKPKKAVPDYGAWLFYRGSLKAVLPIASTWLADVHQSRIQVDLAHAKDQKTGVHTRPVSFKKADALFRPAQQAWAELIREWLKVL